WASTGTVLATSAARRTVKALNSRRPKSSPIVPSSLIQGEHVRFGPRESAGAEDGPAGLTLVQTISHRGEFVDGSLDEKMKILSAGGLRVKASPTARSSP